MIKARSLFQVITWAIIAVGAFSIITGLLSLIGFSDAISDKLGTETLLIFLNSGTYFIICGAIHLLDGFVGICRIKNRVSSKICIFFGIFTLAWQLAACIYLLTLGFISLRSVSMVILPFIFLIIIITTEFKIRFAPAKAGEDAQVDSNKSFVVKDFFGGLKFSFKRKTVNKPKFSGKRKRKTLRKINLGKRRHNPIKRIKNRISGTRHR